jgi:GT2 family glycosyltransferase
VRTAARTDRRIDAELTVVIPTLGRDILARSLEALEQGTAWPAHVVVVDQGQRPAIDALLRDVRGRAFDTLWVPLPARGRATGVNRGIAAASTRFVAITDDDCLAAADWVERIGEHLRARPEAIVTGRVEAGDGVMVFVATDRREIVQRRPHVRFDRLSGGNMAAARTLLHRLGGLDEDACVRTAEDGEFAYRALRAGVPIVYAPDVAVTHLGWRDEGERAAQYESYALSQGGFYGKYLRRGDLFIAMRAGVHLSRALRRWALGAVRGDRERVLTGRAYVLGLLPGLRAGWRAGARTPLHGLD